MTKKTDPKLKHLVFCILLTGLSILVISLIVKPELNFALGIVLGLTLVLTNFIFLIKIVVKFLDQNYTQYTFVVLLIIFKLVFIAGILFLAFKVLKVSVLSFALGYISFMPAMFLQKK